MLMAAQGDTAAFRELFDRHYARAVRVAYRMLGDREQAEDTAMDAFVRIFESRRSYRPQARFTTFLYRVVANLSINAAKKSRNAPARLEPEIAGSAPDTDPAVSLEMAERTREVRDAILSLPLSQRTALILTQFENLSYSEAAEVMNTSTRAVESLLRRARQNLHKLLDT